MLKANIVINNFILMLISYMQTATISTTTVCVYFGSFYFPINYCQHKAPTAPPRSGSRYAHSSIFKSYRSKAKIQRQNTSVFFTIPVSSCKMFKENQSKILGFIIEEKV